MLAQAPQPETTAALIRRFFGYYRPHRKLFLLDFGCAVLSGLLELAFPLAVTAFVDRLLPTGQWGLILAAAAGLLAPYIGDPALPPIVVYWGHMPGINTETEMRRTRFDLLVQRHLSRFYSAIESLRSYVQ